MSDTGLKIENLSKSFKDETAVDDISFTVESGKTTALLGPSGCGKTTTLRCIAGLDNPDKGKISIGGQIVSDPERGIFVDPAQRKISMVFQSYAIWPHMTVRKNVRFPLDQLRIGPKTDREDKVKDILETVGLSPYINNLATNLSGGQQQRVALARALVSEPEILLLDEPLSNLDAKLREEMRQEIKELCNELNVTMLYVTHSQDEALYLSDEMVIMNEGGIVEKGKPAELHANPNTFFGIQFLGKCNILTGSLSKNEGEYATVDTDVGQIEGRSRTQLQHDRELLVCFRPKFVKLNVEGTSQTPNSVSLEGRVSQISTTTDFFEYQIEVEGIMLTISTLELQTLEVGDMISVEIPRDHVHIYQQPE